MEKRDFKKLMENIFIEDYALNKKYTYISQIGVLSIKSLIPYIEDSGVRINYKRFIEELKLWKKYRIGKNDLLLSLGKENREIYWNQEDDSIFSRVIPMIIANQNWEVLKEEIIKNVLFATGNIRTMLETLSISYLIYLILEKESGILEKLKEKIIGFAQVDFLNEFKEYYKLGLDTYPKTYKVEFEKEKIQIINLLNGISAPNYFKLEDVIDVIENKNAKTFIGRVIYSFLHGREDETKLPGFYKNLGRYLENLRQGRIDPSQLEIKEYILPNIFTFNEGDKFYHSLLNDSKIIKKEISNGELTSLVQTKTGMYLFKKIDL